MDQLQWMNYQMYGLIMHLLVNSSFLAMFRDSFLPFVISPRCAKCKIHIFISATRFFFKTGHRVLLGLMAILNATQQYIYLYLFDVHCNRSFRCFISQQKLQLVSCAIKGKNIEEYKFLYSGKWWYKWCVLWKHYITALGLQ